MFSRFAGDPTHPFGRKIYWAYGKECENVIFKKTMFSRFAGDQILAFESENLLSECKRLSKRHFQPEYV